RCMTDRRVARGGFHMEDRCAMGSAGERLLDAAMLVAERDLEMKNLLARALEPEVPRFDDPGVHRADRDLVNLGTVHPVKIGHARPGLAVVTHRLEPWVF